MLIHDLEESECDQCARSGKLNEQNIVGIAVDSQQIDLCQEHLAQLIVMLNQYKPNISRIEVIEICI